MFTFTAAAEHLLGTRKRWFGTVEYKVIVSRVLLFGWYLHPDGLAAVLTEVKAVPSSRPTAPPSP